MAMIVGRSGNRRIDVSLEWPGYTTKFKGEGESEGHARGVKNSLGFLF